MENWKRILPNILLMLNGILMALFWPNLWKPILLKQFEIKPGTFIHKYWSDQPLMNIDIYMFNWTNHQEFTNHSIKPKFQEVGPFRYHLLLKKVNVTYHDNSTVSYEKLQRYVFVPEQSRGKLSDVITTPNVVALSISNQARSFNILKVKGVEMSFAFFGQEIHVTKPISEFLFDGYEDSMIPVASEIGRIMGYTVPFDKRYGWFHRRNMSTELCSRFNIETKPSNLGRLRHWTGITKPDFLETNCSSYEGSSGGELFPPDLIKNNQNVSVYVDEMCRAIDLDFKEDAEVNGIKGKRFIGGDRIIDNGTKYPENECYCAGECVPSGVYNITACRLGAPVFMSYPHFYGGDRFYLDQIEGMNPSKDKHEVSVVLEPTTSLILKASFKAQLNILVKPIPKIRMYRNVPTKFLPIIWLEQSFELDNFMIFMIKLMLWTPFIGQMIGCLMIMISIYLIYRLSGNNEKENERKYIEENGKINEITKTRLPELFPLVNDNKINIIHK